MKRKVTRMNVGLSLKRNPSLWAYRYHYRLRLLFWEIEFFEYGVDFDELTRSEGRKVHWNYSEDGYKEPGIKLKYDEDLS